MHKEILTNHLKWQLKIRNSLSLVVLNKQSLSTIMNNPECPNGEWQSQFILVSSDTVYNCGFHSQLSCIFSLYFIWFWYLSYWSDSFTITVSIWVWNCCGLPLTIRLDMWSPWTNRRRLPSFDCIEIQMALAPPTPAVEFNDANSRILSTLVINSLL